MNAPRITDEAVEAAYDVLDEHGHNGLDCRPRAGFDQSVRAALEAALPHLAGVTPALPTRDELAAAIGPDAFDEGKKRSKHHAAVIQWAARRHMAYNAADAALALIGGAS